MGRVSPDLICDGTAVLQRPIGLLIAAMYARSQ